MNFKLTNKTFNGFETYSNGEIEAIKNGNIFKGNNSSLIKRAMYISEFGTTKGMYFIVPVGAKLVGGSFVQFINVER